MTQFTAHNHSEADVDASQEQIWAALTDPQLITKLTPFLQNIEATDDRWIWTLASIPVLNKQFSPTFTEVMTFEPMERITFSHDPAHTEDKAGTEGYYLLTPKEDGSTHLVIDLEVSVGLPLPRLAKPAVVTAMNTVMAGMGKRFADNLLKHLAETS